MAEEDRAAHDAAAAVFARHGADAYGFAAERLTFCRATNFTEGVALWSAIVDRITATIDQAPARRDARDA